MSLLQLKLLSIHLSTHLFIHLPIYLSALYFKSMDLSVQSLWGTDSIGIIWSFILKVCLVLWPRVISLASSLTTSCSFHWPSVQFSSAQLLSSVRLFATPWITAHHSTLSITNSQSSLKLMSIKSVTPSSYLILCCPLLLLPPIPPSIRVFSNESTLRKRWPKYWSFSFSISLSNEHPGLISFRMELLDLLAVQGTLKSLL